MTDSLHLYAGLRLYVLYWSTIDTFRFNDPLNLLYTTHVFHYGNVGNSLVDWQQNNDLFTNRACNIGILGLQVQPRQTSVQPPSGPVFKNWKDVGASDIEGIWDIQ